MGMAGRCAPHFLFETSKRKCAAPGGKEKMFGGSVCACADLLPPAGEGWHSLVEVRDGNVRPLRKPPARGSTGIHPASLSAAAYVPARNSQRQRKEKQRQYDNHPDNLRTIRHGSVTTGIAEENSVPEGQAKSALAPIRRPPSRGGPLHRSAPTLFSLDRARPVSLLARQKRNGGCILAGPAPPAGAETRWPPSGGPSHVTPAGRCAPADSPW